MEWVKGQRVVSRTEPELGCGIITKARGGAELRVKYPDKDETRIYGLSSSLPVQRYIVNNGEKINTKLLSNLVVDKTEVHAGIVLYFCGEERISETDIIVEFLDQGPMDALHMRAFSAYQTFDLRREAWNISGKIRGSWVNGLVGARIKPLPHQLYVAWSLGKMQMPRAILSDEVGLGKTIEAGLIMSMLRRFKTDARVLILVPDSLKHQWLAEMFRRFNELFTVLDEARCEEELISQDQSAFSLSQKVITTSQLLESNEEIYEQAVTEDWDLVIIDEAHHLQWSKEGKIGANWKVVEGLSRGSKGLLLLTATPQVSGVDGFFGLLHLVDPLRYPSFEAYSSESTDWKSMAQVAKKIFDGKITKGVFERLPHGLKERFVFDNLNLDQNGRNELIRALVDYHGTGRVYFRNRRARLQGFPKRVPVAIKIGLDKAEKNKNEKKRTVETDDLQSNIFDLYQNYLDKIFNVKWQWFADFQSELGGEKALVIVSTRQMVAQIKSRWQADRWGRLSVFHEGLTVVERDIQAARFMNNSDCKILVCSEIGGEGRNFQFVKKLILFDLPVHPDLLEQRIGRLDRIGQGAQVDILIPWVAGGPEEVLYHWYFKGMSSFDTAWNGADKIFGLCKEDIFETMNCFVNSLKNTKESGQMLERLIQKTKNLVSVERKRLQESEDILVDFNSYDVKKGSELVEAVEDFDDDPSMELLFRNMLNFYGVEFEDLDKSGSLKISGGALGFIDEFPGLRKDQDSLFCFDREVALQREEMNFLSVEHPISEELLDFLLNRGEGVACWAMLQGRGNGFLVQFSYVLQARGRSELNLERYLPIQNYLITLDENGEYIEAEGLAEDLQELNFDVEDALEAGWQKIATRVQGLYEDSQLNAQQWSSKIIEKSKKNTIQILQKELDREEFLLRAQGEAVDNEKSDLRKRIKYVVKGIEDAHPRLDSVRFIIKFN